MKVEVEIRELVLRDLPAADREALGRALERELERRLRDGGAPAPGPAVESADRITVDQPGTIASAADAVPAVAGVLQGVPRR